MTRTPTSSRGGTLATWVMLLAGPVVWYLFFWLVYLVTEGACNVDTWDLKVMGLAAVSFFTLAMTVGASALTVIAGRRSYLTWRRGLHDGGGQSGLALAGLILSGIFLLSILATGLPALVLEPC